MNVGPKMVRGRILALLNQNPDDFATVELLYMALDDIEFDTPKKKIREHLEYLEERGYVEKQKGFSATAGMEYFRARITGKGIALVSGDIPEDDWVDPRGYQI